MWHTGGEPDDRAGRRLHPRPCDGHAERAGKHQDQGIERRGVLGEALAGVERKQRDRAARLFGRIRLAMPPGVGAMSVSRAHASPAGNAVRFEDIGIPSCAEPCQRAASGLKLHFTCNLLPLPTTPSACSSTRPCARSRDASRATSPRRLASHVITW